MTQHQDVAISAEVEECLRRGSPVAIGVSGGKDSSAVAFATVAYLDRVGHTGPRILIHSDLGRTEWRESLPTCQRLAERLGLELVVVRRAAGDMLARWQSRWAGNVRRWTELACVKLILPWSTAAMRFCTGELKRDVICRDLVRRFPGHTIVSVSGVRRDESPDRRKALISRAQPKLTNRKRSTTGLEWNAIADWSKAEVFSYLESLDFPLHEAYTKYGSSRVSCAFCILAKKSDLLAATTCPDNAELYRTMCGLELESTFSFQSGSWLSDVAPHLLTETQRASVETTKERAARREAAEALIPRHLLYTKGWPTSCPTKAEAELLAKVRFDVAEAVGLPKTFTNADRVIQRYQELLELKAVS